MKKITFLLFCSLFTFYSFSQCPPNGTEIYSVVSTNDGFVQTLASDVETNEYVTVTSLIIGHNYRFTSSRTGNNDYITLTNTSNAVIAHGVSPLTINNIQVTSVRIHIRVDAACNTDTFIHNLTLIDLTVAPNTCHKPTLTTVSEFLNYRSDTRMDITWNAPEFSTPEGYEVEFVPQGAGLSFSGSTVAPITNISTGEGALTPDTVYDISIRSTCGVNGNSAYTTVSFKTNANPPPANDFCNGSINLIEQTSIANAGAAVPTAGTILGGAGTDVVAELCNGFAGNARDDVWYKFVAKTTNVHVTVEPNAYDAVVTLYSGNCNSLSYLACRDGGTSGVSEDIDYSGLTIGNTYYVRTYYFGQTTPTIPAPTFNIKIWSTAAATDVDNDGYVASIDCNDNNASIHPGATEITANGIDENCDGMFTWYQDLDGDGYGTTTVVTSSNSSPGTGESANSTDCNDSSASIHPGATEVTANGIDENCDGMFTWYQDLDGDGYGTTTVVTSSNSSPGTGESSNSTDCNDSSASIHPGATEVTANGIDENCDGMFTWYQDLDGDGYGTTTVVTSSNSSPGAGESSLSSDCDDSNSAINPGQTEVEGNGLDDDCNPSTPDTTLHIENFDLNSVIIKPNPFNHTILIQLPLYFDNDEFEIYLFDINGRTIFKRKSVSVNGIITMNDLEHFDEGVYFIKIRHVFDGKSVLKRVIKF